MPIEKYGRPTPRQYEEMVGPDNTYVSGEGMVRARKNHTCKGCGKEIKKGETYWKVEMHWDTYQYGALKFCLDCHEQFEAERQKRVEARAAAEEAAKKEKRQQAAVKAAATRAANRAAKAAAAEE